MKDITNEKVLNKQRRQILQAVGATAAIATCPPVLAGVSAIGSSSDTVKSLKISGTVVSKVNDPIKTLVLKNHSDQFVTISSFDNGGLLFDSELVDCNSACIGKPLLLRAGEEKLIQFDFRKKSTASSNNLAWINMQSKVTRLHEGTRVVPIAGTITSGVATI